MECPVPASTIGVCYEDIASELNSQNDEYSAINHINQINYYRCFTPDELRHYDYVSSGFEQPINSVSSADDNNNFKENNINHFNFPNPNSFSQNQQEPQVVYQQISPWTVPILPLQNGNNHHIFTENSQPYGAMPDLQFMVNDQDLYEYQQQNETVMQQRTIPNDKGFANNGSIFQHFT